MSAYENKLVKTKEFLYNWFKEKYGEPSFPKFVDMIIEGAAKCGEDSCSSMDVHWRPYYAACSYCDLPYNFISKPTPPAGAACRTRPGSTWTSWTPRPGPSCTQSTNTTSCCLTMLPTE